MQDDVLKLRDRSTRLSALAIAAQEEGRTDLALALTRLGSEALEHAEEIEKRLSIRPEENAAEEHKLN